ncbi:MAG TPA: metallophosphoesterase family protein, partial [Solirubrobacterales bacterium]|nr:metallophosphoesterase family protein [Solirubrobacterales bacterium]
MQIAIISDIHGNLPALEAVLDDIAETGVEQRWCLGDVVGYGADPEECTALVKDRCDVSLVGNHDLAVLGELDTTTFSSAASAAVDWTRERISKEALEFLGSLSPSETGGEAAIYHASPRDPVWEYVLWPEQATECLAVQDR